MSDHDARAGAWRDGWILSRRDDLVWLQGAVLAGVLLGVAFAVAPRLDGSGQLAVALLVVWGVAFDATHVWGTWARSYLAPDAASRALAPSARTVVLLFVGPAVALADHALGGRRLFPFFLLAAYVWAYWHLVRQHYGVLALYRRRELVPTRGRAAWLLWLGCLYPVARFSLGPAWDASGLPSLVPAALHAPLRLALDGVALAAVLAALSAARRIALGPKHLFVAVVVIFHAWVFATLHDLTAITATLTIFHNLQYHRLVWQYERGHGRVPSGGLLRYLAAGVALGLVWYVPRVLAVPRIHDPLWHDVALGLVWGVALHHYFVDGRIWRLRRGPVLPALARAAEAA